MTSPEEALSGSHGSDRVRMCGFFPAFFFTIVVVQNVGTRDTEAVPLDARLGNRVSRPFLVISRLFFLFSFHFFFFIIFLFLFFCFFPFFFSFFLIFFFLSFFFKYRKIKYFYNVTQVMLHLKRCRLKKYGKMKCLITSYKRKTSNEVFQQINKYLNRCSLWNL